MLKIKRGTEALSLHFPSLPFTQTLPGCHGDLLSAACFLMPLKYSRTSATPAGQVAAILGEPFQIKALSQEDFEELPWQQAPPSHAAASQTFCRRLRDPTVFYSLFTANSGPREQLLKYEFLIEATLTYLSCETLIRRILKYWKYLTSWQPECSWDTLAVPVCIWLAAPLVWIRHESPFGPGKRCILALVLVLVGLSG